MFPIVAFTWPAFILLVGFLCYFLYCTCRIGGSVFEEKEPLLHGGLTSVYGSVGESVTSFWDLNWNVVFVIAESNQYIPRGWEGEVRGEAMGLWKPEMGRGVWSSGSSRDRSGKAGCFYYDAHKSHPQVYEIPFMKLVAGIILTIYGTVVGGVCGIAIMLLKSVPCWVRVNFEYLKQFPSKIYWVPFFFVGWVMTNALLPVVAGIVVCVCLFTGVPCGKFMRL
jgi:hypothetical protein